MRIKEEFKINDPTWQKLRKGYLLILLSTPFQAIVFSFCTWAIIDGFSWTLVPIIPWIVFYSIALYMFSSFFKRAKHTLLILFLFFSLITYFFAVLASAAVFRLFGTISLIIQSIFFIVASIFLCIHYYKYYGKVWDSHRYNNENTVLDQENGRYDFLNNFNMDEYKIKKKLGKKFSNTALTSLIYMVSPIGGGIAIVFSKGHDYNIPIIIGWILSVTASLGFTKVVMGGFYNYRKLVYYEKKLGKTIINGLLE